jgi:phytoene dehydrogenase-like protein
MTLHVAGDALRAASLPVAVIGAGPVGLAAAALLLNRGLEPAAAGAFEFVGGSRDAEERSPA